MRESPGAVVSLRKTDRRSAGREHSGLPQCAGIRIVGARAGSHSGLPQRTGAPTAQRAMGRGAACRVDADQSAGQPVA